MHISSDSLFSKILKKPSIVKKKMIPHIKGLDFSQIWSKKKFKMADLENSKWPPQKNLVFQLRQFYIFFHEFLFFLFFLLFLSEKSSPFIWGVVYFCNMDDFFRILEKRLSELICTRLYLQRNYHRNKLYGLHFWPQLSGDRFGWKAGLVLTTTLFQNLTTRKH